MFQVGQFFKHAETGELYLLVNIGRCPMLVGVQSGNRWSDSHVDKFFPEGFTIRNEEQWNWVTADQPFKFTPVDVRIDGLVITPDWEA